MLGVGAAATEVVAEPPQKTCRRNRSWITGTLQRGKRQYAPGDYTTLRLDRPSTSACDVKIVSDILLGKAAFRTFCLCYVISGSDSPSGGASSVRIPAFALRRRRMPYFLATDGGRGTAGPAPRLKGATGGFLPISRRQRARHHRAHAKVSWRPVIRVQSGGRGGRRVSTYTGVPLIPVQFATVVRSMRGAGLRDDPIKISHQINRLLSG